MSTQAQQQIGPNPASYLDVPRKFLLDALLPQDTMHNEPLYIQAPSQDDAPSPV